MSETKNVTVVTPLRQALCSVTDGTDTIHNLKAENERLRKALEGIANHHADYESDARLMKLRAKNALENTATQAHGQGGRE